MAEDHLSPEPLSSYEGMLETPQSQEPSQQAEAAPSQQNALDVAGPFTKIDLEKQKRERQVPIAKYNLTPNGSEYTEIKKQDFAFNERQIKYREQVLDKLQNRARDDFNIAHDNQHRGLER